MTHVTDSRIESKDIFQEDFQEIYFCQSPPVLGHRQLQHPPRGQGEVGPRWSVRLPAVRGVGVLGRGWHVQDSASSTSSYLISFLFLPFF